MHELGIVTHVAKTIDQLAEENHLTKISSVTLQVGEVSGIMTDYFTDCWNWFKKKHPILKDSELILETIPAVTYCEDCRETYERSEHTYLVQGNETVIKEIAVPENEEDLSE